MLMSPEYKILRITEKCFCAAYSFSSAALRTHVGVLCENASLTSYFFISLQLPALPYPAKLFRSTGKGLSL